MNWHLFAAFIAITMMLFLAPGPIVTLVIWTAATRGVRAGLVTVAGSTTGTALLLAAIVLGLSWVLGHAAALFEALRWLGAAYLVWLGVQAWRRPGGPQSAAPGDQVHFRRGFLVALSNPKTIAFFSAFLPQFLDPHLPARRQLAVMWAVTVVVAALSDSCWAVASGLGHAWFMHPRRAKLLGRAAGVTLIGGAIWLSLARVRPS
jgi:homoserine/homoserine lactone efflux protein